MLVLMENIGRGLLNGKKGVLKNASFLWKDTNPVGTIIRDIA
jgi:hypothetical protein